MRARDVVRDLYGVALTGQGKAFYGALELLAIARGVLDRDGALLDPDEPLRYQIRGYDLARRLAVGAPPPTAAQLEVFEDEKAAEAVGELLLGMVMAVPGSRQRRPGFKDSHLFPGIGELIHYDAVDRPKDGGRVIKIERYQFRGAGGLAYRILRVDQDEARRERNKLGLMQLVADSGSALGALLRRLAEADEEQRDEDFEDEVEKLVKIPEVDTWGEHLCAGFDRIVNREGLHRSRRVELLMHWVPYCIARRQLSLSYAELDGKEEPWLPQDFLPRTNPIRAASRATLKRATTAIAESLRSRAKRMAAEADEAEKPSLEELAADWNQWEAPRLYFTTTMGAIGAFNAYTGVRHFTLGLPLLDAIVVASLEGDRLVEFKEFCRSVLMDGHRMIVDKHSAAAVGMDVDIDAALFSDNAEGLFARLDALGHVQEFSDATRFVGASLK